MPIARLPGLDVHYREDGDPAGPPVVFANSLGTDFRLWDEVIERLPGRYRLIRYDMRGHGLTDCPPAPYAMGALVSDAEKLLEHLNVSRCAVVGLSIGGMIAQGLAVKRPDVVAALVLSNTAAKIGTPDSWKDRIGTVRKSGIEALGDAVMGLWFTEAFRATPELTKWRNMLVRTPVEGYAGCCAAISGSDFTASSAQIRLPTLAIAGSDDGSTPSDLVRETADLIPGSIFEVIRGAGHLPCVEKPDRYARLLSAFLERSYA